MYFLYKNEMDVAFCLQKALLLTRFLSLTNILLTKIQILSYHGDINQLPRLQ